MSLLLLFGLANGVAAQEPTGDFAVVQAAAEKYLSAGTPPVITADALWENLSDGDPDNDPFILSVRKPEHYAVGHIPGAVNIFWKDIAKAENLAKLPTDRQTTDLFLTEDDVQPEELEANKDVIVTEIPKSMP